MLRIARELNNSETAFIFSSTSADYDVTVRFFTPTAEVPLCGHATVAAHYVRAIEGDFTSGRILQKTKAGILPVDILPESHDYSIIMTQGTPSVSEPFNTSTTQKITDALGISLADLRKDCPIAIASAGHSKVMIGINDTALLHRLTPNMSMLTTISGEVGSNGFYVFTLNPNEEVLVHGRMFAPAIGINEDPVTGNANGPLGIYLVHFGICPQLATDTALDFTILQGEAIHRDGSMDVHVTIKDGKLQQVQIKGRL